ncbi:AAA family ATPase, partial [Klebsiella aerogenes]|nr:AAA family ATPase [Klebsiella aerogenes]
MIPSNSLSVLMQIQPTIQRFARMLSSVLQLEVEIVDNTLCRVAGTGAYGKFLGRKLNTDSRLLRYIIETKKEKVVTHSRFDPLCKDCTNKENCKEKAFLGTPVIYQEQCVGVISLVALTREQQERINDNLHEFSDYVRHVSSIFVSRLLEDQGGGDNMLKMFSTMIENMDQGVL